MKNIAIFASGAGSNAKNIITYFSKSNSVRVKLIVSNNPQSKALDLANSDLQSLVINSEINLVEKLKELDINLIVLAGYLKKVQKEIIDNFVIINIHPSLLPKFGGKGMYGLNVHKSVIESGEKQTGITIHYVNEFYDEGKIIFQKTCPVYTTDTPEILQIRVQELEHEFLPKIIEQI